MKDEENRFYNDFFTNPSAFILLETAGVLSYFITSPPLTVSWLEDVNVLLVFLFVKGYA